MNCPIISFIKNKIREMPEVERKNRSWMMIFTEDLDEMKELSQTCSEKETEN
jgi:hypothetical protein